MVQIALDELEQMDGVLNGSHITKQNWAEAERLRQARVRSALSTIDTMQQRASDTVRFLDTAITNSRSEPMDLTDRNSVDWDTAMQSNLLLSDKQKSEARNMAALLWPAEHPPIQLAQQETRQRSKTVVETKPNLDPPYKSSMIGSLVTPSVAYHAHEYAEYSVKRTEAESQVMEEQIKRADTIAKNDVDRPSGSLINDVLAICNP